MSTTPITSEIRRDLWRFFGIPDDEARLLDASPPGLPLAPYTGEEDAGVCLKDTPFTRAFLQWRALVPPSVPGGRVLRMLTSLVPKSSWTDLGAKIETIKAVRTLTNWGLKEAKQAVEGLPHTPILLGDFGLDNPAVQVMVRHGATFDFVEGPTRTPTPTWETPR